MCKGQAMGIDLCLDINIQLGIPKGNRSNGIPRELIQGKIYTVNQTQMIDI